MTGSFLDEMDGLLPWRLLAQVVEPHCSFLRAREPRVSTEAMLRIHFLRQWLELTPAATEATLKEVEHCRRFARLRSPDSEVPDKVTIRQFQRVVDRQGLTAEMLLQLLRKAAQPARRST